MGKHIILLAVISVVMMLGISINKHLNFLPPTPDLPLDEYWGPGNAPLTVDNSIREFKIKFDPKKLSALKERLENSDYFTEPLEDVGFEYGFNNKYLKEVVEFWKTKYDFAEREKYLNQYPQFKTNIQGLDIHFLHVKPVSSNKRVIPLLLLHGWPGSVREFYGAIPLLTKPRSDQDFVFELVIPSLPGYGFSQAASKKGLSQGFMAVIMRNLMERLGYKKYVIHGGDWGAAITSAMATLYPEKIIGYHTNVAVVMTTKTVLKLIIGSFYPSLVVDKKYEQKIYPLSNGFNLWLAEGGYAHIQATKPDTIGIALKDSPVGLLGYIMEKFSFWTNPEWLSLKDGGITKKYKLTDILDNIMIYWSSECITTSVRLYAESFSDRQADLFLDYIPTKVPTAIAVFPNEIMYMTKWMLEDKYQNIVQFSEFDKGGHFAAFEEPVLFANDIWAATNKFLSLSGDNKKTEL